MSQETPTPTHDGKLDASVRPAAAPELNDALVELTQEMSDTSVLISDGYGHYELDAVFLDATQALSLLEWLRQQEATLRQRAKEVQG